MFYTITFKLRNAHEPSWMPERVWRIASPERLSLILDSVEAHYKEQNQEVRWVSITAVVCCLPAPESLSEGLMNFEFGR